MPSKTRRSLNKNKVICIQCKTQVLESDEALQCDVCEKTLHSMCSKLNKKEYAKLVNNPALEYKCHFCEPVNDASVCANDIKEIKTKLNQLDDIKEAVNFMSSQFDSLIKGVAENKKEIKTLKKENITLREEVKHLKSTVKFLNDTRVKNDCVINGIKIQEEDNPEKVVLQIASKAGVNICEDDIEEAYFINQRNKQNKEKQKDIKTVVVKFANKKSKAALMKEKSKLKHIDDYKKVFINDFMCKESIQLLNHARSLKTVGFEFVYARGGKVYAKKNSNSKQFYINSMEDVDKLLSNFVIGERQNISAAANMSDDDDDDIGLFTSTN